MQGPLSSFLRGLVHVTIFGVIAYVMWCILGQGNLVQPAPAAVRLDETVMHVTGPYQHENLSVFLIHSPQQEEVEYITLQEGIDQGMVRVSERR